MMPGGEHSARAPIVSLVVIAYEMQRELPRTVYSLCPPYQSGIRPDDIELIIVDNGSQKPVEQADLPVEGIQVSMVRMGAASPSPAAAINHGIAMARGALVGLWIDGARLASPGILAGAVAAHRMDPDAPVFTLGFHLGHKPQQEAIREGYCREVEDMLLKTVDWHEDGYRLFDICALGKSAGDGWYSVLPESNGLFLPRTLWQTLGGVDERFQRPGGGLVNLDLMKRIIDHGGARPVTLLGEGTFHQIHNGASTNSSVSPWPEFVREYEAIRGEPFRPSQYDTRYLSVLPQARLGGLLQKFA